MHFLYKMFRNHCFVNWEANFTYIYIKNLELPEVGIYKRKQESKKTRKQELDQESDQKNKKKGQ